MKKISTLRTLGLSVAEIGTVLANEDLSALPPSILEKKEMELSNWKIKQELLRQMAERQDWEKERF